ncbi:hypothetical protein [Mobilicoccus pelagius]|uniref:Lipoprotein n=1 Tax=Mobilicoccus pelagius NBRC 104925 TaxID=1089455 RepID=H5UPP4_9MICO|nr:hypothetical protein [Mobilicoccus pelagius]GAB47702.1 hypothetical protein MOPEL_027_00130 [Mobilicoccus pelagius NBRC 104925]
MRASGSTLGGLVVGGLAACALALATTTLARPPALDARTATATLDAVHDARAGAYTLGAPTPEVPDGLTPAMRDELARSQKAIRAAARRDAVEVYDVAEATVEVARVSCETTTCRVDYRVATDYRRPPAAVSNGAPAVMGTHTRRRAEFTLDPSERWLLAYDHPSGPRAGVADPLDAATGER